MHIVCLPRCVFRWNRKCLFPPGIKIHKYISLLLLKLSFGHRDKKCSVSPAVYIMVDEFFAFNSLFLCLSLSPSLSLSLSPSLLFSLSLSPLYSVLLFVYDNIYIYIYIYISNLVCSLYHLNLKTSHSPMHNRALAYY